MFFVGCNELVSEDNILTQQKKWIGDKVEQIKSDDGSIIAVVVRNDDYSKGINFVSKEEFPLQLGVSIYEKGHTIKPHFHLEKEIVTHKIQEVVHIDCGKTIVNLYDSYGNNFKSIKLSTGDTIFFVEGGHGFEMLEDTKIIEVKQGPYDGKTLDKKLIGGL